MTTKTMQEMTISLVSITKNGLHNGIVPQVEAKIILKNNEMNY